MVEESSTWVLEVEEALLDEAPPDTIRVLLAGRPLPASLRADVWTHCLETAGRKARTGEFDDVYDHPDQQAIHQAAARLAGSSVQQQAEAEAILTVHFKALAAPVTQPTCSLLRPILDLALTRNEKFHVFQTVLERFIPKNLDGGAVYDLARLLLLYHDPQLCNHLDSLKIGFQHFSASWFSSLMADDCEVEVTSQLWDLYLVNQDPWIIFFMVTVMLVNFRDAILEVVEDRDELLARLRRLPGQIEGEDIPDLVTLAQVYSTRTPSSFRATYQASFFTLPEPALEEEVRSLLCLPVSADEILASELVNFQFFVVDCRPAEQYNAGHLSRAFHLDCSLMLQDPGQFSTACSALLSFQQSALTAAAGGEHLVFLGDGEPSQEVEANMMMAVSRFLQKHSKYISVLVGGYPSFHQAPPATPQATAAPSPNKLDSLKSNLRTKSASMKESLMSFIYTPGGPPGHVEYNKRGSKLYKGTGDVFSIEDDEEDTVVELAEVERRGDTVHLAACQRVGETGLLSPCHLLVSSTQLVVLLPGPRPGTALPASSRHLASIVKITSKKRQPEIITFKFGTSQNEEVTVFDMDRFFIPTAAKVTTVVKTQIEKLKE